MMRRVKELLEMAHNRMQLWVSFSVSFKQI